MLEFSDFPDIPEKKRDIYCKKETQITSSDS